MIEYIKGDVEDLTPATVTIATAAGIGYGLSISLATFAALEHQRSARLLVHESIRDDAWQLFGFATEEERSLFRLLIGVSGVGANTARMILSSLSFAELRQVIASDDVRRLKSVKGVGAKTAERIIVDLRDKINVDGDTLLSHAPAANEAFDEALTALVVLGYSRPQAQKVLTKLFESEPSLKVDTAIRKALSML